MMLRTTLVLSLCSVAAVAQTNRSLTLGTAPGLGVTSTCALTYPASASGRFGYFLLTMPEPSAQQAVLPGFTSRGLVRVDLAQPLWTSIWLASNNASQSFSVPIPVDAVFMGFSFDVQTADVDFAARDVVWSDNDLELTIEQGVVGQGLDLVWIPAGAFAMGSAGTPLNTAPYYHQANAQPVHPVTIAKPFWIGRYEVTQTQYQAVMRSNPSAFPGPQRPVERVSWIGAMAYCAALTAAEAAQGRVPPGYQYRLPTEAEWEYCYRAGTTSEYWFGALIACSNANFALNDHRNSNCSIAQTANVGSYAPNAWGLHDMAGNVWEWCLDAWDLTANYPSAAVVDPYITTGNDRVYRGGGWGNASRFCRAAYRGANAPFVGDNVIGFRIVLGPVLVP